MKTKYEYIHFEKAPPGLGLLWECYNRAEELLGSIWYDHTWQKHVIDYDSVAKGCRNDNDCLRDIADFLDQLDEKLKGN